MTRQKKLQKKGYDIIWAGYNDDEFYIQDNNNYYFINFYLNNENKKLVDIFIIQHPSSFNPIKFDFINGVPDTMLNESKFWREF